MTTRSPQRQAGLAARSGGLRLAVLAILIAPMMAWTGLAVVGVAWAPVAAVATLLLAAMIYRSASRVAPAAIALGFLLMLPVFVGGALMTSNTPLLYEDRSQHGLQFEAIWVAFAGFLGIVAIARRGELRLRSRRAISPLAARWLLIVAMVVCASASALSFHRIETRLQPEAFVDTFEKRFSFTVPAAGYQCGDGLTCTEESLFDGDYELERTVDSDGATRVAIEVGQGRTLSSKSSSRDRSTRFEGFVGPDRKHWLLRKHRRTTVQGTVVDHPPIEEMLLADSAALTGDVYAGDLRGRFAPPRHTLYFNLLGVVLSLGALLWLGARRRAMTRIRQAHEATIDEPGWAHLADEDDGQSYRIEGPLKNEVGPVLVRPARGHEDYRSVHEPLVAVARGDKAAHETRFADDARNLVTVVLVAVAFLAVPTLAAAMTGRLF